MRVLVVLVLAVLAVLAVLTVVGCGLPRQGPAVSGPVGPWHVAYDGFGQVSIRAHGGADRLTLRPARPAPASSTHAALALSARSWRDGTFTVRVRTNQQLRQPRPNDWEVGWVLWHCTGNQHFYYLILRADGWELGKESPGRPGHQRFLATGTQRKFPPGHWSSVSVSQRGGEATVAVDGRRLVRFSDQQHPYLSGRIGLYTEDASATYQPVAVTPIG